MNELLDSMISVIEPEMPGQCARWGGTVNQWNQNVNALHDFINTRCQVLEPSIVDCYDVTGPFDLTVQVSPATSPNQVMVNTITPSAYPFVGSYFGDVNIDLVAKPAAGWLFDHWEVSGNSFSPDQYADAIEMAFQTSGVVTAFFVVVGPCTPPDSVTVSGTTVTPVMDWADQPTAISYLVRFREIGNPVWTEATTTGTTWDFETLPGCNEYEGQILSVCPLDSSDIVEFNFATPDLLPDFELADAVICNTGDALLDATVPGATYQWDDGSNDSTLNVNAPGYYGVTIELEGCTATDTAQVTQVLATATLQPELCPGETFALGGETFDEQQPTGQVIFPGMAVGGCDSIVQVSLQFLGQSQSEVSLTSCDPAEVGVDTVLLTNALGCDSLVITTTTLAQTSETNLTAVSCNPSSVGIDTVYLTNIFGCDSLVVTATSFDASGIPVTPLLVQSCDPAAVGVDTLLLTSVAGCDSLVITTTTLALFSESFLLATSCNPSSLGIDTVWLTNALGCDSLVITTTTFDASGIAVTPLFVQSCDPSAVGVDTVFLTNALGCDSLVITTTTLAQASETNLTAVSCNPSSVGIDTVYLTNIFGCDSLIITTTTFDASGISITPLTQQSCDPSAVGVDTVLLTNAVGCDSLVITTTTLAQTSETNLTAVSCNPSSVGIDTVYLTNIFGCDSLIITTTTFDASGISITPLTQQSCDPSAVGVDTLSLANAAGCDSLVITTTVFDPDAISVTSLSQQSCDPSAVGVDTLSLTNAAGCDSLVITTTTLAPFGETFLTAATCDPSSAGIDTLVLANQFGCDSLVITAVNYAGLDFETLVQDELCFGEADGMIQLDTVLTDFLPVELVLENHAAQFYSGSSIQWEGLPAGVYSLLVANAAGCTMVREVEIAEANELYLDFGPQPFALHLGDSIWVEPNANFQIASAEWSPPDEVHCPSCPSTFISAPGTADYTLTAYDANGCMASATLLVQVDRRARIFVPNAIRPGSGGPNERLTVFAGPEVVEIQSLQLFDRWGNQLFQQNNLLPNVPCEWDGTFRGELIRTGVIVYMLTAKTEDGRVVNLSGDIMVLR